MTTRVNHRWRLSFGLIATVSMGSVAWAQELGADPEIDQGVELRRQGRDAEALTLFTRAWERGRTPRARAQMALAEQALGRWTDADAHLREVFASPADPWVMRNRAVLDASLQEIARHVDPADSGGGPSPATLRALGLAGAIGGGVLLVGGVVAWVLRESAASQYNDDARCNRDGRSRDQECPDERDSVGTLTALAGVGMGVGAALGVAGAVVLLVSGSGGGRSPAMTLRVSPTFGGAGLTLTGTF